MIKSDLPEKLLTLALVVGLAVVALPYLYHLLTLLIERTFANLPQ